MISERERGENAIPKAEWDIKDSESEAEIKVPGAQWANHSDILQKEQN